MMDWDSKVLQKIEGYEREVYKQRLGCIALGTLIEVFLRVRADNGGRELVVRLKNDGLTVVCCVTETDEEHQERLKLLRVRVEHQLQDADRDIEASRLRMDSRIDDRESMLKTLEEISKLTG